jgi:hypothetical protein
VHSPFGRSGPSVSEATSAGAGHRARSTSRLVRLNDAALVALLVVPQLAWLAVVVYLLHRHA